MDPLSGPEASFAALALAAAAITAWALGAFPVLVAASGVAVILIGRRQRRASRKFAIAIGLALILAAIALGGGLDFGVWEFERFKSSPHYLGPPR